MMRITDEQIKALGEEARAHGDEEQYEICQLALGDGGTIVVKHGVATEGFSSPRTHTMRLSRDDARHVCADVIYRAELEREGR